jgi:hypothetical protein
MVAVVRRRVSRMVRAVVRLREKRCREEGSQEIVVSESICRVVSNRTIIEELDAAAAAIVFHVIAPAIQVMPAPAPSLAAGLAQGGQYSHGGSARQPLA